MEEMSFFGACKKEKIEINGNISFLSSDIKIQEIGSILSNVIEAISKILEIKEDYEYDTSKKNLKIIRNQPDHPLLEDTGDYKLIYEMNHERRTAIEKMAEQPDFHPALESYIKLSSDQEEFINDNLMAVYKYLELCNDDSTFLKEQYFVEFCRMNGFEIPSPQKYICNSSLEKDTYPDVSLGDAFQQMKENELNTFVLREYKCTDIFDICMASIYELIMQNLLYIKCAHCQRFFIASRLNASYCDRLAPESKKSTCKNYAKNQREMKALQKRDTKMLYKKIYARKRNRAIRHPENQAYHQAYREYQNQAEDFARRVDTGEKTEAEFIQWLKEQEQE